MVTMCQLTLCHVPEDLNRQMLGSCILYYFFPSGSQAQGDQTVLHSLQHAG